jgi:hypothetical protein
MLIKNSLYIIGHWETWDWRLKYIPLIPAWLYYCIRSGSFWFFTPSNPSLVFGGFDGVSKREMYKQLPSHLCPKTVYIEQGRSFGEVEKECAVNDLRYPLAVKPETGRMGLMFRKIDKAADLKLYHDCMPVNYMVQEFIDLPLELSVFYYRFPGEKRGTITGFIRKEALHVTGNGSSSLLQLMQRSPGARLRLEELKAKHQDRLDCIIPNGTRVPLSHALNLSRGGRLVSLEQEKDDRLLAVFDNLSHHAGHFYYGRYDIKCTSVEDLKRGQNFCIMEYNGSGGEPHHVYGNGNTLLEACRILRQHWDVLYRISKHNNKKGTAYWKLSTGWKFFKQANRHVRLLKKLDAEFPALSA